MKSPSSLFAVLLLALASLTTDPALAQTHLRFSNWVPPSHPLTPEVLEQWGKNVEQASEGRVVIDFVSALGKPPAHFDLVKNGVADLGFAVHSYTADRFVLTEGAELPFYAPTSKASSIAYWRMYKKFFEAANEHEGVHLISLWTHGPAHIFTRDKEINGIDDLANLKIRVAGGITQEIAERLGAVPFFAPATQSYEVLSKGVADGIFFPSESVLSFKIGPVIKQALKIPGGLYRSSQYVIMNQAKWDALSDADKQAIDSISGEVLAELAAQMWDKQDAAGEAALTEGGTHIKTAEGALLDDIHARLADLEAKWIEKANAKGVDGAAALEFYKQQIAEIQ
jgi:TRAP-type C4-dicarboxylate transport system substrate-binding protein